MDEHRPSDPFSDPSAPRWMQAVRTEGWAGAAREALIDPGVMPEVPIVCALLAINASIHELQLEVWRSR